MLAAVSVGIDKKNEIFADSYLLKPNILPEVIVIPDLLTPGTNDRTWNSPIIIADLLLKSLSISLISFVIDRKGICC